MDKEFVNSTNILSIGYDPATETLEVEFMTGWIYQYYNVPQHVFDDLKSSGSKGQFLNTYIKNAYPYSRVG